MRGLRKKKGQSTMEYVIVFSVITLAIAITAYVPIKDGIESLMKQTGAKLTTEANKIQ